MSESATRVKKMCYIALCTAILCILGPLSITIPISPVPIALAVFGTYISGYVLGSKWGAIASVLYILIGAVGIPVFSGFTGGPAKLVGPTGGYLIGYIAISFFTGLFVEKFEGKIYMYVVGMVVGLVICYILGTIWLACVAGMSGTAALMAGVIPFIPGDIAKIVLAVIVGIPLRTALKKIG